MNRSGFVVVAIIFVGLFAALAGWIAKDTITRHQTATDAVSK